MTVRLLGHHPHATKDKRKVIPLRNYSKRISRKFANFSGANPLTLTAKRKETVNVILFLIKDFSYKTDRGPSMQ